MANKKIYISNKSVAYNGAITGVAAVFIYSLVVMIYAIIRSSLTIYNIMPSGERSNILLANGFSIAYSVAILCLLMALLSSVVGAVTAVILKKSLLCFNPQFNFTKAVIVSSITALVWLIMMYLLLYALLKEWMTFDYVETFAFWFLFPAVIFFLVCVVGGSKLNEVLNKGMVSSNTNTDVQIT
jgi:hypothetical protein